MPTCPRHKKGGVGGYVVALTLRTYNTPTCARVAEHTKRPSTHLVTAMSEPRREEGSQERQTLR